MPIALRAEELKWLEKQGEEIEGSVLNVGSSNDEYDYRRFFPHAGVYRNLDRRKFPNVDIVSDVEQMKLPSSTEDCIVACFMLGEVSNPQTALNEFRRVLKPNGVLLATFQAPGRDKGKPPPPLTRRFTKGETLSLLQGFKIDDFHEYFEDRELVCMFIRAVNPLRGGDHLSSKPGLDVVIRNYDRIVELVKELLKRWGFGYEEIYLFQSRVTGTYRPNSDIDIYVQLEEEHRELLEEKGVDYVGVKILDNDTLLEGHDDLRMGFILEPPIFLDVKVGMSEIPPRKPWYETLHYIRLRELAP